VRVTVDDVAIAELRGHSRTVGGAWCGLTPMPGRYQLK